MKKYEDILDKVGAIKTSPDDSEDKTGFYPIKQDKDHCTDPDHLPPNMISIPYGMKYVHICPSCKHKSVVYSSQIWC